MQTYSVGRMNHLFGTKVVGAVMTETTHIQAREVRGEKAVELPLLPLPPGGPVPTGDGLSWAELAISKA
ncbi:hypothetical protein [Parafrankia sp. FMc2]|uniref:hypothetical protein n=1 Tax=Parafrankia sp. FMc2 TaxID=3233196 RepID=UPI0034D47381